jgi:hypothetical protein
VVPSRRAAAGSRRDEPVPEPRRRGASAWIQGESCSSQSDEDDSDEDAGEVEPDADDADVDDRGADDRGAEDRGVDGRHARSSGRAS